MNPKKITSIFMMALVAFSLLSAPAYACGGGGYSEGEKAIDHKG